MHSNKNVDEFMDVDDVLWKKRLLAERIPRWEYTKNLYNLRSYIYSIQIKAYG